MSLNHPTRHPIRRLAVRAAAAAVAPAILFLGAASAHALPGPGLHFAVDPGSLTVYIDDNSGVSSWCTFNADFYHSPPFFLRANKGYVMVISPAFPLNRTWDVEVNCDNGASTHGQYFY